MAGSAPFWENAKNGRRLLKHRCDLSHGTKNSQEVVYGAKFRAVKGAESRPTRHQSSRKGWDDERAVGMIARRIGSRDLQKWNRLRANALFGSKSSTFKNEADPFEMGTLGWLWFHDKLGIMMVCIVRIRKNSLTESRRKMKFQKMKPQLCAHNLSSNAPNLVKTKNSFLHF